MQMTQPSVIDKNVESIEAKLSIDLEHLESWFNMNHLIVNTSKTNFLLICSSQKRQKLSKTIINVNLFGKVYLMLIVLKF